MKNLFYQMTLFCNKIRNIIKKYFLKICLLYVSTFDCVFDLQILFLFDKRVKGNEKRISDFVSLKIYLLVV